MKLKATGEPKSLAALLSRLQNPEPALRKIGEELVKSTKARITDTKTSPDGKAFAPWSKATLLGRTKAGTAGRGILNNTGNLANSISAQVLGKQVVVGANEAQAPYAKFLQEGTVRMPARPFVGISEADQARINQILQQHLRKR